jgi:hypothetical protein
MGKVHKLLGQGKNLATSLSTRNRDSATAAKVEQPLVSEDAERTQDRVLVDAKDCRQIARRGQAISGAGFPVGDRATDLCGDLFMEVDGLGTVDLDFQHGASNTSSIVQVKAPPRSPDQDELDALIEEARRRARRRRLGYLALAAAAALLAGGIYLAIGGGGGNGAPLGAASDGPGAAAAPGSSPSAAATAYRCPTSVTALKKSGRGNGIPGCSVRFFATLPAGWYQGPRRILVFPPTLANGIPLEGPIVAVVSFANFRLSTTGVPGPIWPIPTPPDGVAIGIFPQAPASKSELARVHPIAIRPGDFHEPTARTNLYTGGWRFQAQVLVGSNGPKSKSLDQANAVLNSIETTQHLCPCGAREHGR